MKKIYGTSVILEKCLLLYIPYFMQTIISLNHKIDIAYTRMFRKQNIPQVLDKTLLRNNK